MSFVELTPTLHELSRSDKVRVIEMLARDLAGDPSNEETLLPIQKGSYDAWTPLQDGEAAQKLLNYLNEEKAAGRA